jgi:predicted metalloprotease with PDZ domain
VTRTSPLSASRFLFLPLSYLAFFLGGLLPSSTNAAPAVAPVTHPVATPEIVPAPPSIQYDISLASPDRHLFHIHMKVSEVSGSVTVQLPAWNALYQIRDFSSHVRQVEARSVGGNAPIEKIDKQSWKIRADGPIEIDYSTYWDEPGPFATQLNSEHAFINPAMILFYVPGHTSERVSLSMSDLPSGWHAASPLGFECGSGSGKLSCQESASSYDVLADSPMEAGKFEQFDVPGVEPAVHVVVHGEKWDKRRLQDQLHRICAYELKLMEGAPYPSYTFFIHLGKAAGASGGGGMEHSNSTAISVRSEGEFLDVAAHEFFHLWNVKRIRPDALDPVDYTKEQFTRSLWFAEGVTSTYAAYTLVRSGLWNKGEFYEDLSEQISDLEARPANRWQSAEQSSLDAWLEKYPLYNRPEDSVSYYTKGQVLGFLLDILIRDRTDNQRSLDDVFRLMNEQFAKPDKPYRDGIDIRLAVEKVATFPMEDVFQRYIGHAEPLPYQRWLAMAGLELKTVERKRPVLGFSIVRDETGSLVVQSVDPESPAAQAGVRADDAILSWNGSEPPRNPERWAERQNRSGASVRMGVRREDQKINLEFRLSEISETGFAVVESAQAGEKAMRIRDGILRGTTQPVTASSR